MKILAIIHGYPSTHNAGAEWMLHEMLKHMIQCGHSADVLLPYNAMEPYEFEGVKVRPYTYPAAKEDVQRADVIISHLDRAGKALNMAEFYHKPYVHLVHNSNYLDIISKKHKELPAQRWVYVIYNSEFTKSANRYINPSIIVHPPIDYKRYKVTKKIKPVSIEPVGKGKKKTVSIDSKIPVGKKITLINLFHRKGGIFFHELARIMPDYEFLGVEGGYGKQEKGELKNVQYLENTDNAKSIYAKTRILLMPSEYESYGRAGIEAMCSGIPVIANPTAGLKESLGDAGIFCNIEDINSWVAAIKALDDENEYDRMSDICIKHSLEEADKIKGELVGMERFFNDIINKRL